MINALSIDLEYWWCNEFLTGYLPSHREDLILESLEPVLRLLDTHRVRATFFVLGSVAEKYPGVVEDLARRKHEIASHGYSHRSLEELGRDGFAKEMDMSLDLLGSYNPTGFRAPSFSANNRVRWYLEILERHGFLYDSSIFPVRMVLYGVFGAPLETYRPSKDNIAAHDPSGSITEFPPGVVGLGMRIPVGGGFYLRFFPDWFLTWSIRRINADRPAVMYLHPWETYPDLPRLRLPLHARFEAYHGIHTALKKWETLLRTFRFQPIREFLHEI